jgi:fructokinase
MEFSAMAQRVHSVVGLGEVLWDLLPQGKQLGGAPANFAFMSGLLGHRAIVASRIGSDALGRELQERLASHELETSFLQRDASHRTGAVTVTLDGGGQPEYEIERNAAWDFMEWTPQWRQLAAQADAICFGSLAQRSEVSRETIRRFLDVSGDDAIRIFDVNLREDFVSATVLADSLRLANVAKLNDLELPRVMRSLGFEFEDEKRAAERLRREFGLQLVCVTRGSRGSLLVGENESDEHPGFAVAVADLVGAGDSFTAALAHHLLLRSPLKRMNEAANRMGAWVAGQRGATPRLDPRLIREVR